MAAAIASGLIRQKRQAREQHAHRPTAHRRRKSPGKKQGLCNGNLVDIFSKVRIFGLKKRRLRRQGVEEGGVAHACTHTHGCRDANLLIRTCARASTHACGYALLRTATFCAQSPSRSRPGRLGHAYTHEHTHAQAPRTCKNTHCQTQPQSPSLSVSSISLSPL